jgi:pre-mRNA-splicing factor SYF1
MDESQITKGEVLDLKKLFKAPDEENLMDGITNPYSLRSWWNSIQALDPEDYKERAKLYYRALYFLPGSFKLWFNFLTESIKNCKRYPIHSKRYQIINTLFEKSLVYMNKMPRIWLDYCKFLGSQKLISQTRETYDRALVSLPLTQHDIVWKKYVFWVKSLENLPMIKNVYKRYLKFSPNATEEYIDILLDNGDVQDAVEMYVRIMNDENYHSKKGLSQYQLWMQLCELISKHPDKLDLPNAERIIKHGIRKYTDEVGKLWICLADYNTRKGMFEKAREIFEQAIANVVTARDFSIIFNAYMNFEETVIEKDAEFTENDTEFEDQLDKLIDQSINTIPDRKDEEQLCNMSKTTIIEQDEEDYKFFKLENLIQRRPFLLSNTNLRQNPSNVYEWLNRVKLCNDDDQMMIQTYLEAIFQIDPQLAYGKASKVWIEFASFYEKHDDITNANEIYKRAVKIEYKNMDELASVY